MQVWCIVTDTGETNVTGTAAASQPLTVCSYPEVKLQHFLSHRKIYSRTKMQLTLLFFYLFVI